ncbi:MAG: hypothetical protein AUK47_27230 [Deltaproteobacteria bacterium CG2_30_63_29]|nr:MAG: hypothetical protein AUK47_27230 [Deltaproteobacteria bacterium CG2_30_63_29]
MPSPPRSGTYGAVAIGASAGGLRSLTAILQGLPADFSVPILLAQHLHSTDEGRFADHLSELTSRTVVDAIDKVSIQPRTLYVAPADYHLLVERDGTLALSIDARVNYSRPSIDVLFESAAHVFGPRLIAVILSGASSDGARGMLVVKELGGVGIAEAPKNAEFPLMPQAAIDLAHIEIVLPPDRIAKKLSELCIPAQRALSEPAQHGGSK